MSLIQVKGTFISMDEFWKSSGRFVSVDTRERAIIAKLKKDGFISGAYIRPVYFEDKELIIPEGQVEFLVRGFDPDTQIFSIELTTDNPFPEGCEVAMCYECIQSGEYGAKVVGIYFAYLNNVNQMPYGHFEVKGTE